MSQNLENLDMAAKSPRSVGKANPRDLVCKVCWDGLFNTQAYQDFFSSPDKFRFLRAVSEMNEEASEQVIQTTTAKYVRNNCSVVLIERGPGRVESIPNPDLPHGGPTESCNWCQFIGGRTCCALREDGSVRGSDECYLEISFQAERAEYSTPKTALGYGGKIIRINMDLRDPKAADAFENRGMAHASLVGNSFGIHAYTTADDLAASLIVSRPPRSDVASEDATRQIEAWINECESQCCGKSGGFFRETSLPKRVIDVGLNSSKGPRLLETNNMTGVYATLSYRWGQEKKLTLLKSNLSHLMSHIDMEGLPRTIQDAITVTRKMQVPYLWVDALCIIQNDEDDKAREIGSMHKIYAASAVTIIASQYEVDDGFLKSPKEESPARLCRGKVTVPVRVAPGIFGTMTLTEDDMIYEEDHEPISWRAWTTQEHLLAQRRLMVTAKKRTMTWTCPHSPMTRAFGESMHLPYWPAQYTPGRYERETLNLIALAPDPTTCNVNETANKNMALSCWLRLTRAYSWRVTTLQNDKLNALAGIAAQCYKPFLGPGYFAGIWEYDLLRQLAWKMSNLHDGGARRPVLSNGLFQAPSWSWASLEDAEIEYMTMRLPWEEVDHPAQRDKEDWMVELVDITTRPKHGSDAPLGEIEPGSGRITLRGKLRRAWWHASSRSIFRTQPSLSHSREPSSLVDPNLAQSPMKRYIFNQDGSLHPDSDSDCDSEWGIDDERTTSQDGDDLLEKPRPSCGRSDWNHWTNVYATYDEQPSRQNASFPERYEQKKRELETVEPVMVYLLPLVEIGSRLLHEEVKDGVYPHYNVRGLLLVKDREAMRRTHGNAVPGRQVLFRRVGSFFAGSEKEFEQVKSRNITII